MAAKVIQISEIIKKKAIKVRHFQHFYLSLQPTGTIDIKIMNIPRKLLTCFVVALITPLHALAQSGTTTEIEQLEKQMYQYFSSSESDSFMLVCDRLKEACEKAGAKQERLYYKAWANQAIYYFTKINRSRGLEMAQQILDNAHQHDSKFGIYTATYAMSSMQVNLRRHDQAEKGFLEAIEYQHRYFPEESAAAPYLGLAKIYVNQQQTKKVIDCAHKALAEPGVIKQHQLSAWSYICIALSDDHYTTEEFNKAYASREKVKLDYGHDDSFGETVEFYHARKNGQLDKAMEILKTFKAKTDKMNLMSSLYAQMGNYKEAYLWHKRYKAYQDSANTAEVQQLSYEYASQLDVSRAENEAKDLRLSNQTLQIRAGIIIALLTLVFLSFYLYRRRKQLQELRKAYNQLEETTSAKERIDSELRIARDIQMSMVPHTFPAFPERKDIDLYASIISAKEVGGDLYDFFLQDEQLYFCVGDVSGKGVPASLTMAVAVNMFRTVAKEGCAPETIATKLNDTMSQNNENSVFVTMFIGRIDLKSGRMDFCNCGHNPPVFGEKRAHTSQTVFNLIETETNAPIGLWPELQYQGGHIANIKGCTLFVYTDGLNEAENKMQDQFGEKRMLRVLRESTQPFGERKPKTHSLFLVEEMKCALEAFVDGAEQSDDLTMLCICLK